MVIQTFPQMGNLNSAQKRTAKVNIIDVGVVLVFFMLAFLVNSLWLVEPDVTSIPLIKSIGLGSVIFGISIFVVVVYLFAMFTGTLGKLKLLTPFYLIAAILSAPIWIFYNIFLPLSSSVATITTTVESGNVLSNFFGPEVFAFIQTVLIFATFESFLFGILLLFFLEVGARTKGTLVLGPVLLLLVLFTSILHGAFALALDVTGQLDFVTVILHQIVAFTIMGVFFIFLGMPGNIVSHQIKNTLALGAPLVFLFWLLLLYLALTIIAVAQANRSVSLVQVAKKGLGV